jgi:hypothetical protein
MSSDLFSWPGGKSLERFAPMTRLLSRDDLRFFDKFPQVAAQFRQSRYDVFLAYLRDLHREIAMFNRESSRLIAHGAWDLLPHLCRKRALLLYHEARLYQAAICYRWLPVDVSTMVTGSLTAIIAEVGALATTVTA